MSARTLGLTAAALVAFAANSWLCRAALRSGSIDAASFTAVRLGVGAAVLALLAVRGRSANAAVPEAGHGSWPSALALFAYAISFSLAYLSLDSGIGALLLFGAVQLTMLAGGVLAGHRPTLAEVAGMAVALAGLVVLAAPGVTAPPLLAAAGMALAGVAWGIYSLRGRGARRPLLANAGNFARAVLPAAVALAVAAAVGSPAATRTGLTLAAISGGITSGLGYAIWYAALPGLGALQAGLVQLAVPVLTALGGVALLGERITPRLALATLLVLGGIAAALRAGRPRLSRAG